MEDPRRVAQAHNESLANVATPAARWGTVTMDRRSRAGALPTALGAAGKTAVESGSAIGTLRFDRFAFDLRRSELCRDDGTTITLRPKAEMLLREFLAHPRRLLGRDELMAAVWPHAVVTDDSLVQGIGELRVALGDQAQRLIRTVPRRGYLFEASVDAVAVALAPAISHPASPTRGPRGSEELARSPGSTTVPGSLLEVGTGIDVSQPVAGFGGRPAIAVLPFANLSGDPEQEYFADGLTEDILTRLSMWRWLPVIARNSSFRYKGRAVDVKQIGRSLGARYVLEGSVRKAGERVRVTGQLIDAVSGHHLWAQRYERVLEDLFAIQDELTDSIVGALEPAVGRAVTERAHVKPPGNLDAWDLHARGWWHLQRSTRDDFATATSLLQCALQLDPGLAMAHCGLAFARVWEVFYLWTADPRQSLAEAMVSARAALAADPLDSMAYAVMAMALVFARKHDEAYAASRKAIELNPSNAGAYWALGIAHLYRGEAEPGIRATETALRISPNDVYSPSWLSVLSGCHYLGRDYVKAAEVGRLAVQRAPQSPMTWRVLAIALGQLGSLDEAREAMARFLELMPSFTSEQTARSMVPHRDEADIQHWLEGLRKAGWQG